MRKLQLWSSSLRHITHAALTHRCHFTIFAIYILYLIILYKSYCTDTTCILPWTYNLKPVCISVYIRITTCLHLFTSQYISIHYTYICLPVLFMYIYLLHYCTMYLHYSFYISLLLTWLPVLYFKWYYIPTHLQKTLHNGQKYTITVKGFGFHTFYCQI